MEWCRHIAGLSEQNYVLHLPSWHLTKFSHPVRCRNEEGWEKAVETQTAAQREELRHGYIRICRPDGRRNKHTGELVWHVLLHSHIQRLTKHHNPLLQPKAHSLVLSIYNGAYFFLAKKKCICTCEAAWGTILYISLLYISLYHLWPKNNKQIILLIQVVLLFFLNQLISWSTIQTVSVLITRLVSALIDTVLFLL